MLNRSSCETSIYSAYSIIPWRYTYLYCCEMKYYLKLLLYIVNWIIDEIISLAIKRNNRSLYIVALDGIGHLLGLPFNQNLDSIMYQIYRPFSSEVSLYYIGVKNIKNLYNTHFINKIYFSKNVLSHHHSLHYEVLYHLLAVLLSLYDYIDIYVYVCICMHTRLLNRMKNNEENTT